MNGLYKIHKEDIKRAALTLADAFQKDPIWKRLFKEGISLEQQGVLYESPVRYCYHYGEVYATSKQMEGIFAWLPGHLSDMNLWRLIRSGSILPGIRSINSCTTMYWKQPQILKPIETDRKHHMKDRQYIYLMIIGVATEFQGKGFGKQMIQTLIEKSNTEQIPLYLETETDKNVKIYERFGFKLIQKITLPIIHLPMWEMIREPD